MPHLNCTHFLQDYIGQRTYLVICVILIVVFTVFVVRTGRGLLARLGLLSILLGGLQNLYHRVRYICVWDNMNFLDMFVFNLADVLITAGILLILWDLFKDGKKNTNNRR